MPPRKRRCVGTETEELPEPVLHHIMSFLDFREVIRVSIVSKAWKKAASTLPCLNITAPLANPEKSVSSQRSKFLLVLSPAIEFIMQSIMQNLFLHKFNFKCCDVFAPMLMILLKCLDCTRLSEFVRELTFQVSVYSESWNNCEMPRSIYSAVSLQKLVLTGLRLSFSELDGIDLPSLRELDFRFNHIGAELLERIIMKSPQLEILKIIDCSGFEAFRVLGPHHKLKRIRLGREDYEEKDHHHIHAPLDLKVIEIKETPNLEYLLYFGNGMEKLHVLDVAACKNLKVLKLISICGDDNLVKSIEQLVSSLIFLQFFQLHEFRWIYSNDQRSNSIRVSSNSLRELWLVLVNLGVDVQVETPHLSVFFYFGFISSSLSWGTSFVKEVVFVRSAMDRIRYDKFAGFLRSFNHIEKVQLVDFVPRHFKVLKRLRHNSDPPLWDVKHLTIRLHFTANIRYIPVNLEMLQGLLWMAPHLETLSFEDHDSALTFEFVHENLPNVEEAPSVSPSKIKVKVGTDPGDIEGFEWKMYFFDDGNTLAGIAEELKVLKIMFRGRGDYAGSIQEAGQEGQRCILRN